MKYKNIAGVVFGFRRNDYLKRTIDSLEKNTEANNLTWYAFLDGAVNQISGNRYAEDSQIEACKKVFEDSKLNFTIIQNRYNKCIALQKEKAHQLYNDHDCIFFFEDDLVVSPYYIRLLRIALEQHPMYTILMNTNKSGGRLNQLTLCNIARIWGYGMSRELYHRIATRYTKYVDFMKDYDYLLRNNAKGIRGRLKRHKVYWHSHDINITRLSREFGKGKLWPRKTRGFYIGEKGAIAYRTKRTWLNKNMHKQPKDYIYRSDKRLDGFVIS